MSDQPSNAASERQRRVMAALNRVESRPKDGWIRAGLSDDFSSEDRRRGPSFPDGDADSYARSVASSWEVGSGHPRFALRETVAVRDERFAACVLEIDYGNGMISETLHVIGLDPTMRLIQRTVEFDTDDVDGAVAELDRMRNQADGR
jgi:hypothetical protein